MESASSSNHDRFIEGIHFGGTSEEIHQNDEMDVGIEHNDSLSSLDHDRDSTPEFLYEVVEDEEEEEEEEEVEEEKVKEKVEEEVDQNKIDESTGEVTSAVEVPINQVQVHVHNEPPPAIKIHLDPEQIRTDTEQIRTDTEPPTERNKIGTDTGEGTSAAKKPISPVQVYVNCNPPPAKKSHLDLEQIRRATEPPIKRHKLVASRGEGTSAAEKPIKQIEVHVNCNPPPAKKSHLDPQKIRLNTEPSIKRNKIVASTGEGTSAAEKPTKQIEVHVNYDPPPAKRIRLDPEQIRIDTEPIRIDPDQIRIDAEPSTSNKHQSRKERQKSKNSDLRKQQKSDIQKMKVDLSSTPPPWFEKNQDGIDVPNSDRYSFEGFGWVGSEHPTRERVRQLRKQRHGLGVAIPSKTIVRQRVRSRSRGKARSPSPPCPAMDAYFNQQRIAQLQEQRKKKLPRRSDYTRISGPSSSRKM